AGQTFYLFTIDNLKQFGALKAMGTSNQRIVSMVLMQALVVGLIGFGVGMGMAALAEELMKRSLKAVPPAMYMAWQLPVGTAIAVALIMVGTTLFSLRRALRLEPASVFR